MANMDPTEGRKADAGKPRMELLPGRALTEVARVLTFGAEKYDADNWRGGMSWRRLLGAAYRHLTAFNEGEDKDPETGLGHLAHLACCAMFLLDYEVSHPDKDDRYKRPCAENVARCGPEAEALRLEQCAQDDLALKAAYGGEYD